MSEYNAIIKANNEIDRLKREIKRLKALCVQYSFDMERLEEENEELKKEIEEHKAVIRKEFFRELGMVDEND